LEETGLQALELVGLGPIHPNSAIFATSVEFYAARCEGPHTQPGAAGQEQLEFKWFSVEEAMEAAQLRPALEQLEEAELVFRRGDRAEGFTPSSMPCCRKPLMKACS
jgi:hypothetical protein